MYQNQSIFCVYAACSNWRKQLGQQLVLPSGEIQFAAWRHARTIPLHQVECHVTQDREIVCAVIVAISRAVLVHDGVENPVKPVFDAPIRTNDLSEAFGRQRCAEQIIGGLGRRCACGISGAGDFSYCRQTRLTPTERLSRSRPRLLCRVSTESILAFCHARLLTPRGARS